MNFNIRICVQKHSILLKLGIHDELFNDVRIIERKNAKGQKNRSKYGDVRIIEVRIIGSDL